jgi:hypothetical protein
LNFSEPTNGAIFFGSLYLVGIEQIIETVGPTTPPSYANTSVTDVQHNVQAGIAISGGGTFQVQAQYSLDDDEWQITGNLPGDVMIDETAAGVNRLFSFSIPIEEGATVTFFSTSNTRTPELVIAEAVESNAHASVTANLHASAWGYATADGMLLEDGDIDGDGDVDDDDFGNWLPNFPTDIGATLTEGDIDADGDVDLDDLQVWRNNTISLGIPGDFGRDDIVDGTDFLSWQRGIGTLSGADPEDGDADGDGDVDGDDLSAWKLAFGIDLGTSASINGSTIPEPSSFCLTATVICLFFTRALKTHSRKL